MPKKIDHEVQRKHIALAAIEIFRRRGYDALSFREIARELNMSKSGLYHYFSGKEELFSFCGTFVFDEFAQMLPQGHDLAPADALSELAQSMLPVVRAELRLLLDFVQVVPEQQELPDFLGAFTQMITRFCDEEVAPTVTRLILGDLLSKALGANPDDWSGLRESLSIVLSVR